VDPFRFRGAFEGGIHYLVVMTCEGSYRANMIRSIQQRGGWRWVGLALADYSHAFRVCQGNGAANQFNLLSAFTGVLTPAGR